MGLGWFAANSMRHNWRQLSRATENPNASAEYAAMVEGRRRAWFEDVRRHTVLGDSEIWRSVDQEGWVTKTVFHSDTQFPLTFSLVVSNLIGFGALLNHATHWYSDKATDNVQTFGMVTTGLWAALVGITVRAWWRGHFIRKVNREFAASGWDVDTKLNAVRARSEEARLREKRAQLAKYSTPTKAKLYPSAAGTPDRHPESVPRPVRMRKELDLFAVGRVVLAPAVVLGLFGAVTLVLTLWP